MGKKYLLDTNVIIDFSIGRFSGHIRKEITQIIDNDPCISIINKIELLGFSHVPPEIVVFTERATVFSLDDDIISQTIALRKLHKIKLPDAIIAATSIVYDLILVTGNSADFKKIKELQLLTTSDV